MRRPSVCRNSPAAAVGSHCNSAFGGSLLGPTNVGINFSGGGDPGDSLGISFLTSQT